MPYSAAAFSSLSMSCCSSSSLSPRRLMSAANRKLQSGRPQIDNDDSEVSTYSAFSMNSCPKHFCFYKWHLFGPSLMRVQIFRSIGLKVWAVVTDKTITHKPPLKKSLEFWLRPPHPATDLYRSTAENIRNISAVSLHLLPLSSYSSQTPLSVRIWKQIRFHLSAGAFIRTSFF